MATGVPGLNVGFGGRLIGDATLDPLNEFECKIVRTDCQEATDAGVTACADEILAKGMQPLVIVRRASQMRFATEGSLIEFGNEPDLKHFGWTVDSYLAELKNVLAEQRRTGQRVYLPAISNLNSRGFSFLRKIPWATIPSDVCCSIHRYPNGHSPEVPHDGFSSRQAEVDELRSIVRDRPLAVTEVGYHNVEWTREESAKNYVWEREFFKRNGFDFVIAYQINDGPDPGNPEDNYGFRDITGVWKPVARTFFTTAEPPKPEPPPALIGVPVGFSIDGFFLCAENGGGQEVTLDRSAYGPWETWHATRVDDAHASFQASNGMYLCAELDGTVVANRLAVGPWETWAIEVRGSSVAFKSAHGKYLCANGGAGTKDVVANRPLPSQKPEDVPAAWELFTPTNMDWWETLKKCRRPLIGALRVQEKRFRDDTGYRRVFCDSDFNLMRKLKYEPKRYYSSLDACCDAGYQGTRQMGSVGGWMDFWAPNYGVYPISFTPWYHSRESGMLRPASLGPRIDAWPDFDDLWRTNCREHRKRDLRMVVSFGDGQIITPNESTEIELHQRLARICAQEGGSSLVLGWEIMNEIPQNYPNSLSTTSVARMGRVIAAVRQILPDVLFMQGAGLSEEPETLYLSSQHGEACSQHTTRQPPELCLKRTFGLWNWEGQQRFFWKPYYMMEPAGFNVGPKDDQGDDMYAPWTDKGELTALYGMHMLLGMASNFFTGADVRGTEEAEHVWGYSELPVLFDRIFPEDISTWDYASDGRGGIMYFYKGKDFVTSTHKTWNNAPPFPIASWTFYQGDVETQGTGTPPPGSGVVVGKFK